MNEPLHIVVGVVGFSIFIIEMIFFMFSSRLLVLQLGKHKDGWRHLNRPRTRYVCMKK
jgi:hypothetical protein